MFCVTVRPWHHSRHAYLRSFVLDPEDVVNLSMGSIWNLTASVVWWLACWPLVPEFAGSIPTEAVGFFPM
jgi:hypothetical protein